MQLIGAENIKFFGPEDEGSHTPGPHESWQESVVLIWSDMRQKIGGMFRLGHEPNTGQGEITLFSTLWDAHWVYKTTKTHAPLHASDRTPNTMSIADKLCRFEFDGTCRWRMEDEDVSASFWVEDFHAPLDPFPRAGNISQDFASNHTEANGLVKGTLTLKGRRYEVDGLAIRDHSWGNRDWHKMLSHRWIAGNLGPDFNFCAIAYLDARQNFHRFAYVIREGRFLMSTQLEIVTYQEDDTITHRGGIVRITLADGEVLEIRCEPLAKGAIWWAHEMATNDTLCRATCGSYEGFCDFETTTNPLNGRQRPLVGLNAYMEDGLFPAQAPALHKA